MTGVYWKPVYYLLDDEFECWLLNAQHLRNVPGRKTDVADSAWICQLVEHVLVRPSFVPDKPIRELRDLTRYRKVLIQERTREAQRLHKVLEDAGLKLSCVATDVLDVSGRAMLDALVAGTHDPEVLADLARGRLRAKLPALRDHTGRVTAVPTGAPAAWPRRSVLATPRCTGSGGMLASSPIAPELSRSVGTRCWRGRSRDVVGLYANPPENAIVVNQVESWFSILSQRAIRRAAFTNVRAPPD